MTDKDIVALLRNVKDAPEFGGDPNGARVAASWSRLTNELGFTVSNQPKTYTLRDYAQYVSWTLRHAVARPLALGFSIFAVMFGSWVATVNASFDSVPGDVLYPVKIATERVQLTLAANSERRAKLHVEFAGRRLQEVAEIAGSARGGKEVRVKAAMSSFKQELTSANAALVALQDEQPVEAASVALVLDRKTDEYETLISQTDLGASDEVKEDVESARETVEQTNDQVIETLVGSHETTNEPQTAENLQGNFQQEYQDVTTRIALSLGRLTVIESALSNLGWEEAAGFKSRIRSAREAVSSHDVALREAMDTMAAGGYRRSFELLSAIDTNVRQSENIIVELEIEITTKLSVTP